MPSPVNSAGASWRRRPDAIGRLQAAARQYKPGGSSPCAESRL